MAPNLLNFAVAELPLNAFRKSYHVGASDNDQNGSENIVSAAIISAVIKARRKKDTITKKAVDNEDKNNEQEQLGDALTAFHRAQSEKAD